MFLLRCLSFLTFLTWKIEVVIMDGIDIDIQCWLTVVIQELKSCGYTHLGFGAFRRVNGLGWVQLRFHFTLGDAVTQ